MFPVLLTNFSTHLFPILTLIACLNIHPPSLLQIWVSRQLLAFLLLLLLMPSMLWKTSVRIFPPRPGRGETKTHTDTHTHTSSNYNKKLGLCRFWIVSSFTVQSSFSLPGQSLKLWSTRRSVKRLARIKRYMFDHLLFFPHLPFCNTMKTFLLLVKDENEPFSLFHFLLTSWMQLIGLHVLVRLTLNDLIISGIFRFRNHM